MAETNITSTQINSLIKSINDLINKSGSKLIKKEKREDDKFEKIRFEKLIKNTEDLKKEVNRIINSSSFTNNNITRLNTYSSQLIENSIENTNNIKQLDKILKVLPKDFSNSIKKFYPMLSESIKNMDDVFKVKDLQVEISNLFNELKNSSGNTEKLSKIIEKSKQIESNFNIKLKDLGIDIKRYTITKAIENEYNEKGIKLDKDLQNEIKEVNNSMNKFNLTVKKSNEALINSANKNNKNSEESGGMFKSLAKGIASTITAMSGLKELHRAIKSAGKFGVALDPVTAVLTGLSLDELPELQGKLKQTALSIGGMESLNRILKKSMDGTDTEFVLLSGGLANASKALGNMADNVRKMGDNTIDTNKAIDDEKEMFKKFQSQIGMTIESFNDMTTEIINDTDIRNQLMRLDMKQRKLYIDNIRITQLNNMVKGLETEQTKAVVKTLTEFANLDPKERLKQAAKVRVLGGVIGMSKEANEVARLLMKNNRTSEENNMLIENMSKIQSKSMQDMSNINKEFVLSRILNSQELNKLFGPNSSIANLSLSMGKQFDPNVAKKEREAGIFGADSTLGNMLQNFGFTQGNIADVGAKADQVVANVEQGAILGGFSALTIAANEAQDALLKSTTGIEYKINQSNSFLGDIFKGVSHIANSFSTKDSNNFESKLEKIKIDQMAAEKIKIKKKEEENQNIVNVLNYTIGLYEKIQQNNEKDKKLADLRNEEFKKMTLYLSKLLGVSEEHLLIDIKKGKKFIKIDEKRQNN